MKTYSLKQKCISCILKAIVIISAVLGVFFSAYAGRNSFMGGRTVFMFFTIQSNIAVAITSIVGAYYLSRERAGRIWSVIHFVATVSITLTGMVFCFVLAPTLGEHAWNLQNILTHVVVPIAAVLDFFVVGASYEIKSRNTLWVIVPPIIYAIYAGIGYVMNWQFAEGINYPYFFLNWGSPVGAVGFSSEFPFMGCVWWILALLIFLLVVGCAYLGILKLCRKTQN